MRIKSHLPGQTAGQAPAVRLVHLEREESISATASLEDFENPAESATPSGKSHRLPGKNALSDRFEGVDRIGDKVLKLKDSITL